jgi:hypothetical protein
MRRIIPKNRRQPNSYFGWANWEKRRNRAALRLSIKDGYGLMPIPMPCPHCSEAPPMSENSSERRFADLDALRRQLEEMASRRSRSEKTAEDRRLADQGSTLVIRGK